MTARFNISRRAFIAAGAGAILTLASCGGSGNSNDAPKEETKQTVSVKIGDSTEVLMDIPQAWTMKSDDKGYANITPDGFDGMVLMGINVSSVSAFTSDEEALQYWVQKMPEVDGQWQKVSDDQSPAPIYEAGVQMTTGKKSRGYLCVVISGDDMVAAEALCSDDDWNAGKDAIQDAVSTYRVTDPQAPNYSEPKPKDVFTIVSAAHAKDLGYGFWRMDVTVQNNSDSAKKFLGFQIDELDAEGNIINSYMSYNKNASYSVVEPGQKFTIQLTEADSDNIAGMQSRYCVWGDSPASGTQSDYSTPFKQMF